MSKTKKTEPIKSEAKPHTIKKFELIEKYIDEWARKILGYKESKGVLFIDCMCNSGLYYDADGNDVYGTPIRISKCLNEIIKNYAGKKAVVYFNDLSQDKINALDNFLADIDTSNIEIHTSVGDGNAFLKAFNVKAYWGYNTMLLYDPFEASIDWDAVTPFLKTWGEVIINHMVSDTKRGAAQARRQSAINKYETTYQKGIDELISLSGNRNQLEQIVEEIITGQMVNSDREFYISTFPFINSTNTLVYNLIHCCSNIKGKILFKKIAWQVFGGKSSAKNTHGNENQLMFGMDGTIDIATQIDETCYYVKDIAQYIYKKYKNQGTVSLECIYNDLDNHPIFPSDGFKLEIKKELKEWYHATFTRTTVTLK